MKKWFYLAAITALSCAPCSGFAAEGAAFDELNITGTRVAQKLREIPASVAILSTKEVETVNYRKPEELFRRVPGITTLSFSGEDAATSVRLPPETANRETIILVDGLPSFTYGRGSGDFWNYFNARDMDRIELLRGPSSSLYGNGAMGGVINVITKTPPAQPEIGFWGEYGRNDRLRGGAYGGARVGQLAGNLDVNMEYNDGWREHSRVEKQVATGNVQYFLDDASILRLRVDFVHSHSNLPGALDTSLFFSNPQQSNNTFGYDRIDRITPTLTYERKIGDSGKLNLAVQVQSNTSENAIDPENFRYLNTKYEGIVSYRSSLDVDLKARYSHELKELRSRITGGVDYSHSDQQSDSSTITLQPSAPQPVVRFTSYNNQTKNDSYDVSVNAVAPYLQLESTPVERLRLLVGGRYDAVMYDATGKNSHSVGGSRNFNEATFRVGAVYDIVKELNLCADYTQGFLAPGAEQLYTAPSYNTSGATAGLKSSANGNLNPEKSQGYEVGIRSNFWEKRARFDVSWYDMTVRDKIVRNSVETNPLKALYYYQNAAKTNSRGVELLTSVTPVDLVRATFAYTYARNVYDAYTGLNVNGNLMPRAPESHFNARLALLPLKGLEVELEVDEVTKQYADDANTMVYSRPTLVNLRANYAWQNWSFWAHVLNLTNQSYASYVSQSTTATVPTASYFPGEPLTFYVGAAYKWN